MVIPFPASDDSQYLFVASILNVALEVSMYARLCEQDNVPLSRSRVPIENY
jgi:hypothetical protein